VKRLVSKSRSQKPSTFAKNIEKQTFQHFKAPEVIKSLIFDKNLRFLIKNRRYSDIFRSNFIQKVKKQTHTRSKQQTTQHKRRSKRTTQASKHTSKQARKPTNK